MSCFHWGQLAKLEKKKIPFNFGRDGTGRDHINFFLPHPTQSHLKLYISTRVKKICKPANQVCGTTLRIFGTIANLKLIIGQFGSS